MISHQWRDKRGGLDVLIDRLEGVAHLNQQVVLVRHDSDLIAAVKKHLLPLHQSLAVDEGTIA